MMRMFLQAAVMLAGGLVAVQAALADSPARLAFGASAKWESKYVTEGRDNLGDGGIITFEGAAEWEGLTAGAWLAVGDSESYQELDLYIEYGFATGPIEAYVGYTRLEFLQDDEGDNEVGFGFSVVGLPHVTPGLDYYHSTGADGGFLEISIRGTIGLHGDRVTLERADGGILIDGFHENVPARQGRPRVVERYGAAKGAFRGRRGNKRVQPSGSVGDSPWILFGSEGEGGNQDARSCAR